MEIRGNTCFLTPEELFQAAIGAMNDENDHDLYTFLNVKGNALDRDLDDPDNPYYELLTEEDESLPDDYATVPAAIDEALAPEIMNSRVGLIEIPFGDVKLVERIASCIAAGRAFGDQVQEVVERLAQNEEKESLSASQQRVRERDRRRERFGGRPPYLRLVSSKEEQAKGS